MTTTDVNQGAAAAGTGSQLTAENRSVYPDANHGFLNQSPELFADQVSVFLNAG